MLNKKLFKIVKGVLIVIFAFFPSFLINAQISHVFFTGGTSFFIPKMQEKVFSPSGYYSLGGMLDIGYRYETNEQLHIIRVLVGAGPLIVMDSSILQKGYVASINLDARSLFQVYRKHSMIIRLGGSLLGSLDALVPFMRSFSWLGEAALGVAGDIEFEFGRAQKHHINFFINLPLGVLVSRPDLSIYGEENELKISKQNLPSYIFGRTQLVSFDTYIRIDIGAMYRYRVSRAVSIGFRYDFSYRNVQITREIATFLHLVSFNVLVNFPVNRR